MPEKTAKTIPLNDDTEHMLISAVRYAIGRRTYVVGDTVEYMLPLLPDVSRHMLFVLYEDLKSAFAMYDRLGNTAGLGDQCDIEEWKRLRSAVMNEVLKRDASYPEDYYPELEVR